MDATGGEAGVSGTPISEAEPAHCAWEAEDGATDDYLVHEGGGGLSFRLPFTLLLLTHLQEPLPAGDAEIVAGPV